MSRRLYTANGQALELIEELGKGGEGSVFTLQSSRDIVAKVYHASIDQEKQAKLIHMTGAHDEQLLKYAAWPQVTLHERRGGPVVGFTMEKVGGMKPIQSLYSPAQRKQEFSQRGFDFLLVAARNTAAAFTVLHQRGFVAGDVNHGNLYVSNKAVVKLIDTDSYQLHDGRQLHLCEVGVSTYTPPELQGMSFRGITRTANHDNFGLGLLIWHLLMGGRHPFAGVPQRDGIGETIEENIQAVRYAYAKDAKQRLLLPPPSALPVSTLPPSMVAMFEKAFTEPGRLSGRPTAKQWLDELDSLRNQLRPCAKSKVHTFPSHLGSCPWCEMDSKGVIYFVSAPIFTKGGDAEGPPIKVGEIWAAICAIPALAEVQIPSASKPKPQGEALPPGVFSTSGKRIFSTVITACIIAIWVAAGGPPLLFLFAIGIVWLTVGQFGTNAREEEKQRRSSAKQVAHSNYVQAVANLKRDAGGEQIQAKRELLNRLKLEFDGLATREQKDLASLRTNAEKRQRTAYLERFFIERATIPGVGPAKRAALQAFGIETAAEVDARRIRQVKGFGERLTKTLVDWRASHERNFRFNPATALTPADAANVKQAVRKRAAEIHALMTQGLKDLQQAPSQRDQALRRHGATVQNAADRLAQAEANWKVLT